MGMKTCITCKETKKASEFHKNKRAKDGMNNECKICVHERYMRDREKYILQAKERRIKHGARIQARARERRIKRTAFVRRLKQYVGCKECGEKNWRCLDFHHVDEKTKEYNIGRMLDFSMRKIKKEIRKCIVLCANCHRKKQKTYYG